MNEELYTIKPRSKSHIPIIIAFLASSLLGMLILFLFSYMHILNEEKDISMQTSMLEKKLHESANHDDKDSSIDNRDTNKEVLIAKNKIKINKEVRQDKDIAKILEKKVAVKDKFDSNTEIKEIKNHSVIKPKQANIKIAKNNAAKDSKDIVKIKKEIAKKITSFEKNKVKKESKVHVVASVPKKYKLNSSNPFSKNFDFSKVKDNIYNTNKSKKTNNINTKKVLKTGKIKLRSKNNKVKESPLIIIKEKTVLKIKTITPNTKIES